MKARITHSVPSEIKFYIFQIFCLATMPDSHYEHKTLFSSAQGRTFWGEGKNWGYHGGASGHRIQIYRIPRLNSSANRKSMCA